MLLRPLGRADQPVFLGVPAGDQDRALRRPAALERRAEAARHLEHRRRARIGIDGAMRPRVAMIAEHDQLLRLDAALDPRDDVVDRLEAFVHLHVHRDGRRARPDVIRKRQAALPLVRHARAAETPQDLLRFGVADRQRRNLRHVGHLLARDPLRAGDRRASRASTDRPAHARGTAPSRAESPTAAASAHRDTRRPACSRRLPGRSR